MNLTRTDRPSQQWLFPLQERGLVLGFFLGVGAGMLFWSLTVGLATWVVSIIVGLLWRRGDPPIFSLCLTYQWLFIVTGFTVWHTTGEYPGLTIIGDLHKAVWISLTGLLVLACGIRLGQLVPHKPDRATRQSANQSPEGIYAVAPLFRLVLLVFAANYFVEILPKAIFLGGAEIIRNMLAFRFVLLFLLLTTVARKRSGYGYGAAAMAFVLIPMLISSMSKFQTLLFYLILVMLHEWRPWLRVRRLKAYNRTVIVALGAIALVTLGLALFWVGGIKPIWRPAVVSGSVTGSPMQKLAQFIDTADSALGTFDAGEGVAILSERVSSGIGYFSLVLQRVPDAVPHADGELTMIGLEHIAKPRILFPNKRLLGSDSWLIWRYAGVAVGGRGPRHVRRPRLHGRVLHRLGHAMDVPRAPPVRRTARRPLLGAELERTVSGLLQGRGRGHLHRSVHVL